MVVLLVWAAVEEEGMSCTHPPSCLLDAVDLPKAFDSPVPACRAARSKASSLVFILFSSRERDIPFGPTWLLLSYSEPNKDGWGTDLQLK